MECPFGLEQPECDFALECQVLTAALDEAEDLRTALNKEADSLRCRIRQLEEYILSAGLPLPLEL